MDCSKVGNLILRIRKEKGMTQKQIAEKLGISDKTVSKWECGMGCPDVSLLNELAEVLGINVTVLLEGTMDTNNTDGGNMKRVKFYVCPDCGNIITSTSEVSLYCCGKSLTELVPNKELEIGHEVQVETVDHEYYIHMEHEMTKSHYISFIAYVTCDKLMVNRLYPEQNIDLRFRKYGRGMLYVYCNQHGLLRKMI